MSASPAVDSSGRARALAVLGSELAEAGASPLWAVGAVAAALAARVGAPAELAVGVSQASEDGSVHSAALLAAVEAVAVTAVGEQPAGSVFGQVYEASLGRDRRRRAGVFFTPPAVAAGLVARAWPAGAGPLDVWDPAVGGGAFLLAAGEAMVARGVPAEVALGHLCGTDVDAGAIAAARLGLHWWAWSHGGRVVDAPARLQVADALQIGPPAALDGDGFGLVVGNPPFLGQLRRHSARTDAGRSATAGRFGVAGRGYVDDALLFLLVAVDAVRAGGRVVLVLPEATLAAAHGLPARRAVAAAASLRGLWLGGAAFPGVGVRVCAPVLERVPLAGEAAVARWAGTEFASLPPAPQPEGATWAPLLVGAPGSDEVPDVAPARWTTAGTVADLATATAGFRDQYYGLVPYVLEGAAPGEGAGGATDGVEPLTSTAVPPADAPLVTVGMLDPLRCGWGLRAVRFGGRRWQRPVVDLVSLERSDPALGRWVRARLVPKLVVAPQGRLLEVVVDEAGAWVPSVPVVSIEPRLPADDAVRVLWQLAAVLLSPLVTAHVCRTYAGSGLGVGTIRVAARQLLELPLPGSTAPWIEAADLLRALARPDVRPSVAEGGGDTEEKTIRLHQFGTLMTAAYGQPLGNDVSADLLEWWTRRIGGSFGHYDLPTASSPFRRRSARNRLRNGAL